MMQIADYGVQLHAREHFDDMKYEIICDSGSSIAATFTNPKFLENIREADTPMHMTTNAGCKDLTHVGDVRGFGEAWFDPTNIANVFGMAHLSDKYRITMDTDKENAIIVHSDPPVKFVRRNNMYVFRPDPDFGTVKPKDVIAKMFAKRAKKISLLTTVKENEKAFTERQRQRAIKARELYEHIGAPTIASLKFLLRYNLIKNCDVTVQDVETAEQIYGPDIAALKGKSVRRNPTFSMRLPKTRASSKVSGSKVG